VLLKDLQERSRNEGAVDRWEVRETSEATISRATRGGIMFMHGR
jgi:hypothetical protein